MRTGVQTDYLKENADNIWFVLGAYFFAFFPWMIMHNIDFISDKWRTCRRTRRLAHTHLGSSILPIIYVAVYAEAQRRKEDNKEFAAALTALMFNVYQLMRTIMGWVQLNAFVAWCAHAVECIRALEGEGSLTSQRMEVRGGEEKRKIMQIVGQWRNLFVSWCKRGPQRVRTLLWGDAENDEQRENVCEKSSEASVNVNVDGAEEQTGALPRVNRENGNAEADANSIAEESGKSVELLAESNDGGHEPNADNTVGHMKVDGANWIEDKIMVNNMVVDNELGGREVTVLPSWEKMWCGVRKGRFTPSTWLRTDRVILNTIRWGGAYLCGMGEGWSLDPSDDLFSNECGEILESFFSREMFHLQSYLLEVEWDLGVVNDVCEFLSLQRLGVNGVVELTGRMINAYGNRLDNYDVKDTYTVDAYSFEFNSLVGSYPARNERYSTANREKIAVGLVHSVLLAKHLGVEKLKAIRRYYDRNRMPEGPIHRNAVKLLLQQTSTRIADDATFWKIFSSPIYEIPIFPYRMQMVALWDEATNWRVLQASAHYDLGTSLNALFYSELQNEEKQRILYNAPQPANIFDYNAKWTIEQINRRHLIWRGSLGVVLETVRTFLAEWVAASGREPDWEPDIPTACVEFNTGEIPGNDISSYVTWTCQRELQRKVAEMLKEEENFPGNAALIMLFILGFPLLQMDDLHDAEVGVQSSQGEVQEASIGLVSNTHRSIDLSVHNWRVWTFLSPQKIALLIRIDERNRAACLRLENNSADSRFLWQDWVDAAMGCVEGYEMGKNGEFGYGRKIVRSELRKPMVELCPLHVTEDGIEAVVKKTSIARVWMGWPAFAVGICKFEVDQWLHACGINMKNKRASREIENVERVVGAMIPVEDRG